MSGRPDIGGRRPSRLVRPEEAGRAPQDDGFESLLATPWIIQNQKARHRCRALRLCAGKNLAALRRLVLDRLVFLGRLGRTTARALGERGLDLLDRLGLGDTLDGCDLAREPVQRRLVEL